MLTTNTTSTQETPFIWIKESNQSTSMWFNQQETPMGFKHEYFIMHPIWSITALQLISSIHSYEFSIKTERLTIQQNFACHHSNYYIQHFKTIHLLNYLYHLIFLIKILLHAFFLYSTISEQPLTYQLSINQGI